MTNFDVDRRPSSPALVLVETSASDSSTATTSDCQGPYGTIRDHTGKSYTRGPEKTISERTADDIRKRVCEPVAIAACSGGD